jgi:hypothetical protein
MKAEFYFDHRRYICSLVQVDRAKELKIKNHQGLVLAVKQGQKFGLIGKSRHDARQVDVSQPYFYNLIKAAMNALDLASKDEVILDKNRTIANAEKLIEQQSREISVLNEQMNLLITQLELLSAQQNFARQQLSPVQLIENEIIESDISQEVDRPLSPLADLPLQSIEDEIAGDEISQECDRPLSPLADLPLQSIEDEIAGDELSQEVNRLLPLQEIASSNIETEVDREIAELPSEIPDLGVRLMEDRSLEEETQEAEEIVDSEIAELPVYPVEFESRNKESEIKRLPKRSANRRMRKKS